MLIYDRRQTVKKMLIEQFRQPLITVALNVPALIELSSQAGVFDVAVASVKSLGIPVKAEFVVEEECWAAFVLDFVIPDDSAEDDCWDPLFSMNSFCCANRSDFNINGEDFITFGAEHSYNDRDGICQRALSLKRGLVELEERHPLGRLFDLDLYLWSSQLVPRPVERKSLGKPFRHCFLCEQPALLCRRRKTHSSDQLKEWLESLINGYLTPKKYYKELIEIIRTALIKAVTLEAVTTPKPGLVDCRGAGVHKDMTIATLMRSAACLTQFVVSAAETGASFAFDGQRELTKLLSLLRPTGLAAEEAMFLETKGVNTHKGIIFSASLLCAATGFLWGTGELYSFFSSPELEEMKNEMSDWSDGAVELKTGGGITASDEHFTGSARIAEGKCLIFARLVCSYGAMIADGIVQNELVPLREMSKQGTAVTYGEKNWIEAGSAGIRGEAEAGFPSVCRYGLPQYLSSAEKGYSDDISRLRALMSIMTALEDGNVIARGGFDALCNVKRLAQEVLKGEPVDSVAFDKLDNYCLANNLSSGGAADMLVLTIFLRECFKQLVLLTAN